MGNTTKITYRMIAPRDAAGAKHLQDQIARSLGLDDGRTIEWEYEQVRTRGKTGLLVRIEEL